MNNVSFNIIDKPKLGTNQTLNDSTFCSGLFECIENTPITYCFLISYDFVAMWFGFAINLLALFVIIHGKSISKKIKIQLANLAIADLICSLTVPVLSILKYPPTSSILFQQHENYLSCSEGNNIF